MIKKQLLLTLLLFVCIKGGTFAATGGWADENGGTTGGEGGDVVTVYNFTQLENYAEASVPYIIQVSGTINVGEDGFDIHANKTIIGLGSDATLVGNVGFQNREGNIILENLHITNPCTSSSCDGLSITQDIYNVLITKCTIYDCGDGCLDISNRSDYITVSWCKFYYSNPAPVENHRFASLVGSRDSATDDDGKLNVTYHHNWWSDRVHERMPRVRYGQVHCYNNYFDCAGNNYCIGVGVSSHIRVENNYFNNIGEAWADYYTGTGYPAGHIGWNAGNEFDGCTEPIWATNEYSTIFTPPYDYTLNDYADIPVIIPAYAGAGTPYPPHWVFGPYGDFDMDGDIDPEDFETFVDYWMDTEGIDDADYDGSGRVDMPELALFAGNWLMGI